MNEENLIPFGDRTESEQREIRSKGGKASGKKRRRQSSFRKLIQAGLAAPMTNKEVLSQLIKFGIIEEGEEISHKEAASYMRIINEICNPTPAGFEKLVEFLGEDKEKENREERDSLSRSLESLGKELKNE